MKGWVLILLFKKEILTLAQWWEVEARVAVDDRNGDGIAQEVAVLWLLEQALASGACRLPVDLTNDR